MNESTGNTNRCDECGEEFVPNHPEDTVCVDCWEVLKMEERQEEEDQERAQVVADQVQADTQMLRRWLMQAHIFNLYNSKRINAGETTILVSLRISGKPDINRRLLVALVGRMRDFGYSIEWRANDDRRVAALLTFIPDES